MILGPCPNRAVHWDVFEDDNPYDMTKIVRERFGCCGRPACHGAGARNVEVKAPMTATCGRYEVEVVDRR